MKKWHTVQDYLVIVFCACLLALSYHIFVFPNEFAPSGLPGIATIIQHVFHFKVGYMTILINVPLVLLTYFIVDHRYAVLSATFAVVFSVVLLALDYVNLAPFEYHTTTGTSTILAPIAGGVISGFCYGMVMRRDSSTGGTDLRPKLPDNAAHFRPQKPLVFLPALLSGHGKRLAGKSSGYNVNCSQSGLLIKTLLCQGPDIPPARDVRPVLFEHRRRIICHLALPDGRKTGPLGRKIKAAD